MVKSPKWRTNVKRWVLVISFMITDLPVKCSENLVKWPCSMTAEITSPYYTTMILAWLSVPFYGQTQLYIIFKLFFLLKTQSPAYVPVYKPDLVSTNWPKKSSWNLPSVFSHNLLHRRSTQKYTTSYRFYLWIMF